MGQRVDEVLDITRIESGAVALQPAWLDVEAMATRVGRTIEEPARLRGIRLSLAIESGLHVSRLTRCKHLPCPQSGLPQCSTSRTIR